MEYMAEWVPPWAAWVPREQRAGTRPVASGAAMMPSKEVLAHLVRMVKEPPAV